MENSYGVGVFNRYALFLDEPEDPVEALMKAEREKEALKNKKVEKDRSSKSNVSKQQKSATPTGPLNTVLVTGKEESNLRPKKTVSEEGVGRQDKRPVDGDRNRNRGEPRERRRPGPGSGNMEPREQREQREQRSTEPRYERSYPQDNGHFEETGGRGRGSFRGRGSRGGRGGRREFDRRSGSDRTGMKAFDKKEGGGGHNWGKAELDGSAEAGDVSISADNQEKEAIRKESNTANGTGDVEPQEEAEQVEPEPEVFTLDEWKARQEPRETPKWNLRKVDDKAMKGMKKLEKERQGDSGEESDEDEEGEHVHEIRGRRVIDIPVTFTQPVARGGRGRGGGEGRGRGDGFRSDRGRGGDGDFRGRGGRGEFRGRGGRGRGEGRGRGGSGYRGGYAGTTERPPVINDEAAFPSLA